MLGTCNAWLRLQPFKSGCVICVFYCERPHMHVQPRPQASVLTQLHDAAAQAACPKSNLHLLLLLYTARWKDMFSKRCTQDLHHTCLIQATVCS